MDVAHYPITLPTGRIDIYWLSFEISHFTLEIIKSLTFIFGRIVYYRNQNIQKYKHNCVVRTESIWNGCCILENVITCFIIVL